jgi:hypothetical protein
LRGRDCVNFHRKWKSEEQTLRLSDAGVSCPAQRFRKERRSVPHRFIRQPKSRQNRALLQISQLGCQFADSGSQAGVIAWLVRFPS